MHWPSSSENTINSIWNTSHLPLYTMLTLETHKSSCPSSIRLCFYCRVARVWSQVICYPFAEWRFHSVFIVLLGPIRSTYVNLSLSQPENFITFLFCYMVQYVAHMLIFFCHSLKVSVIGFSEFYTLLIMPYTYGKCVATNLILY